MLTPLTHFLTKQNIRNGSLLVGVSGGADSVALLRALHTVAERFELNLVAAHFDHAIRDNSAEDAEWVARLASQLQIPFVVERRVAERTDGDASLPSEESARDWRYCFFRETARIHECRWVAVAHTADDQAETVLHHIVRGSGLKGLGGIPPVRPLFSPTGTEGQVPLLIRPLLEIPRTDLLTYLDSLGQDFRTDPTNEASQYTRNRIRLELLPLIREQFNSRFDDALSRLAVQARETQELVEEQAGEFLSQQTLEQVPERIRIRRDANTLPMRVLLREMFRQIWEKQNWPRQGLGFSHLEKLAEMYSAGSPRSLSLPGSVEATCRRQVLELKRSPSPNGESAESESED